MQLRIVAALSMTLGILVATIGPVPAAAAPAAWVMPNVKGMVLKQAMKEIREVTGSAKLNLKITDLKNGQEVINQTNWTVCSQGPGPGRTISQKNKKVLLYVKRFNQRTCT